MNKSSVLDHLAAEANALYKFTVSYDGTLYEGFQRQNARKTVQLTLETALKTLGWQGTTIISAGRTDSGVHAAGQIFTAALDWKHGTGKLKAAMNANLPEDIVILSVDAVKNSFHARYDATSRTYRYRIYFSELRNPLKDRYQWRIWPETDIRLLNQAAASLIGEHDFSAFGSPPRKNGRTVRSIMTSKWFREADGEIAFSVEANGFLYHMVRRLVYSQVQFAQGRLTWDAWLSAVLHAAELPNGLAPPNGLCLQCVKYDAEFSLKKE